MLYAAADVWVGPLAAVLGAPYEFWPEPMSFIMVEVFRKKQSGDAFVRLTRNSEVIGSFVSLQGREDGLVPWKDALSKLQPLICQ